MGLLKVKLTADNILELIQNGAAIINGARVFLDDETAKWMHQKMNGGGLPPQLASDMGIFKQNFETITKNFEIVDHRLSILERDHNDRLTTMEAKMEVILETFKKNNTPGVEQSKKK